VQSVWYRGEHPQLYLMLRNQLPLSKAGLEIKHVVRKPNQWVIFAESRSSAACPVCRAQSTSRHSHYGRRLWDMPIQGVPVRLNIVTSRWRCRNPHCERHIFSERLDEVAQPHARWTRPLAEILRVFGHTAGGRPAERLLGTLGMTASDSTILRHLRRAVSRSPSPSALRVVGIDDWAWTKGQSYGTIMVDLEAHTVVDVLPDRSAASVAKWLRQHPGVEVICRDRHGLYAEGARQGAPQARQVADRFHLIDNLRERLEQQMGGHHAPLRSAGASSIVGETPEQDRVVAPDGSHALLEQFTRVKTLYRLGNTASAIVKTTALSRKRVDKWIRLDQLPERNKMAPTTASPSAYHAHLSRRWNEGVTQIRWLLDEIRRLGYTGCRSRLAEYISPWRTGGTASRKSVGRNLTLPVDPMTGTRTSSLVATAVCMKPRPMLTQRQLGMLRLLKAVLPGFRTMRLLALQFRALLRSRKPDGLAHWIADAMQSGIFALQRFAKTLRRDADAVRNAISEPWSSGQVEGQINRLKTMKRAMFGRAGRELLRARMLPLHQL
jgi:transposase